MLLREYEERGAIVKCPPSMTPHIIFPLNTIPKSTPGKFRIISDCRYLNQFVSVPEFRMEDLASLHKIALPGDYIFSIDLKDGYFHVPIKPEHWKYFGFRYMGTPMSVQLYLLALQQHQLYSVRPSESWLNIGGVKGSGSYLTWMTSYSLVQIIH